LLKVKGKGLGTCYSAAYMSRLKTSSALQSRKWQLIGMSWWYCGALCGHPLPAVANNWTTVQHTDIPLPQSAHWSFTP